MQTKVSVIVQGTESGILPLPAAARAYAAAVSPGISGRGTPDGPAAYTVNPAVTEAAGSHAIVSSLHTGGGAPA